MSLPLAITFASPIALLGLALIPIAMLLQRMFRRRAQRYAVRYTGVETLRAVLGTTPAWRRHLPAALALLAMASLVLALAKPNRTVAVPAEQASVVLVTDHSRSMMATDVSPTRLEAARAAALRFLSKVPGPVRVGAVAYSDAPDAVQAPTTRRDDVRRIINGLVADGSTATGDALAAALEGISRDRKNGRRPPAAIVLLSDGKTTTGSDPLEMARTAGQLHIPIYTVALGTANATVPNPGFGPALPVPPDPETLGQIAQLSGGRAFTAQDSGRLATIYRTLGSQLGTKGAKREVTSTFVLLGLGLLLGGSALSVRSRGRLP
jgi:Ca-activated chloride channel family protein